MRKYVNHGEEFEEDFEDVIPQKDGSDFNFTSILNKFAAENRNIYLWGDVEEESAISVISQLHYFASQNKDPIQLIIHSSGGEVDAQLSIIDEMIAVQNSGITVSTIVTGKAYSAAALILIMGSIGYRYARPNASIMLHPVSYGLSADYAEYQEKMSIFIKHKNKVVNEMIGKQVGLKTEKQIKQLVSDMDKGLWLTPEDALNRRMIDNILDITLPNIKGKNNAIKTSTRNTKRRNRRSVQQ